MTTINSPLGNKSYQGGMKEYVVDELPIPESEIVNPNFKSQTGAVNRAAILQSLDAERNVASNVSDSKISASAKKRIEMLCGISSLTREVDINGNLFVIKALKSKENRQALVDSVNYDGTVQFSFELRRQILARSVFQVAGIDLDVFLGTQEFAAKLEFIDELDDLFLDRLYNEYMALTKDIKTKYSINKEEDVKEVVEEIKK